MTTYVLIDSDKLNQSFSAMNYRSKEAHLTLKNKLLNVGKVSVSRANILGHEYLLWLEKRGIVKEKQ